MAALPPQTSAPLGHDPDAADGGGTSRAPSLISQAIHDGELKIRAVGAERHFSVDIYYRLMRLSWPWLGTLFVGVFVAFNLAFAGLYHIDPSGLAIMGKAAAAPPFWRDFFFSVHTVATIGYGNIYPVSLWANTVVVVEITLGIIYFALATGIAFARFSRPTARILFSRRMIVRDVDGVPTLMLRAANQRHNVIYSAQARLSLLVDSEVGGVMMRRFVDLALIRQSNPAFALTWTMMHPIDADSPLFHWLADPEVERNDEIIVTLSGSDEISGHTIHGRWAYRAAHISWGFRFADIITTAPDGWRVIDYGRFHDVLPG
jgi:inward rectifier potassium channel